MDRFKVIKSKISNIIDIKACLFLLAFIHSACVTTGNPSKNKLHNEYEKSRFTVNALTTVRYFSPLQSALKADWDAIYLKAMEITLAESSDEVFFNSIKLLLKPFFIVSSSVSRNYQAVEQTGYVDPYADNYLDHGLTSHFYVKGIFEFPAQFPKRQKEFVLKYKSYFMPISLLANNDAKEEKPISMPLLEKQLTLSSLIKPHACLAATAHIWGVFHNFFPYFQD